MTLVELIIALTLVAVVLAILLPTLESARVISHRGQCADNLRRVGGLWFKYLNDNNQSFPYIALKPPGWYFGGARFSSVDGSPFPDTDRPLTWYMSNPRGADATRIFQCPADRGITGDIAYVGTGTRSAFRAFGTSYRANDRLLDVSRTRDVDTPRAAHLHEVTAPHGRLVLTGSPAWYEVGMQTGRHAHWHGKPDAGNMLFLDGSVQFVTFHPETRHGPIFYDPFVHGFDNASNAGREQNRNSSQNTRILPMAPLEPTTDH